MSVRRPERRKSALSSGVASVIAPPPVASEPARVPISAPKAAPETARLSIRVDAELLGQVRAAWWSTAASTGTRSMSAWIIEALEEHLRSRRLMRARFHGGQDREAKGGRSLLRYGPFRTQKHCHVMKITWQC